MNAVSRDEGSGDVVSFAICTLRREDGSGIYPEGSMNALVTHAYRAETDAPLCPHARHASRFD